MRRRRASCSECGRRTALTGEGKLWPHRHPGWHTPCPGGRALNADQAEKRPETAPTPVPQGGHR